MKIVLYTLLCLLYLTINSSGQTISISDSLRVMVAVSSLFKSFEKPNYDEFKSISTNKIDCVICEKALDSLSGLYVVKRQDFFDKYFNEVKNNAHWARALHTSEIMLGKGHKRKSNFWVYFTTWQKDEYAPSHEGAQLVLHFKKIKREYRFSGVSTIP